MQQRRLSLMLAALLSPSAMAGGLALYETSAANSALANAGAAARAQGAETIASNPAGMTRLAGTQLQVNGGAVYGDLELDLEQGGNNGGNALQSAPLGSLYLTHALDEQWVAGLGLFGSHGLGIDYGEGWQGRGYVQSAKLTGIAFAPSLAYRVDDHWSVGASLIAMHGALEASLDMMPNGSTSQAFSDSDWAYGASFGVLYELDQDSRIGLSYFSELKWELDDQPLRRLNGAGLGVKMMIPQTLTLSGYHQLNPQWALLASANWQQWSRFGEVDLASGQQRRGRRAPHCYPTAGRELALGSGGQLSADTSHQAGSQLYPGLAGRHGGGSTGGRSPPAVRYLQQQLPELLEHRGATPVLRPDSSRWEVAGYVFSRRRTLTIKKAPP